jgi:hypothetical protein
LSMCVKMSFVYLRRFTISKFAESIAEPNGYVLRSPRLFTYVTILVSDDSMISVWSWKLTYTTLLDNRNIIACLVRIHFFT